MTLQYKSSQTQGRIESILIQVLRRDDGIIFLFYFVFYYYEIQMELDVHTKKSEKLYKEVI